MRHAGRPYEPARRGMMAMEVIVSLIMAVLLLMSMTMEVARVQRAQRDLARQRAGARKLEAALSALQTGGAAEKDVAVERIGSAAPAGEAWVRVLLRDDAGPRHVEPLVGLVPADRAPAGGAP